MKFKVVGCDPEGFPVDETCDSHDEAVELCRYLALNEFLCIEEIKEQE